jgi:hypothetical protein
MQDTETHIKSWHTKIKLYFRNLFPLPNDHQHLLYLHEWLHQNDTMTVFLNINTHQLGSKPILMFDISLTSTLEMIVNLILVEIKLKFCMPSSGPS